MKSVGIITFHASHNYGSNLQAYALKTIIRDMGCNCEIINFRTLRQKDQYMPLTKRIGLKYLMKNSYFLLNYHSRKIKYDSFENFIDKYLIEGGKEYSSLNEIEHDTPLYDYYISGSDQIWNTAPLDADMAYFLPFVKTGKRIAYAPSFGQIGNIEHRSEISQYLNKYDALSVREEFGRQLILEMTGRSAPVLIDPTLLIGREVWEKLIPDRLVKEEYIFFYTLFATKEMINIVKHIASVTGLKIVISNISNQYEILSGFEKKTDAGPLEFLGLIKYAKLVCTTSFHGTLFSILLNKPFFAINGMSDNRISTLLNMTDLKDRAVTCNDVNQKLENIYDIDFTKSTENINREKYKAISFLKKSLDIGE